MSGKRMWTVFVCLLTFVGMGLVADACTVSLPKPPMWVLDGDNEDEFLIGIELDSLFDVSEGTTCACGLSFSSPLPFGSSVDEAFVAVTDRTTHAMTLVNGFNFTPNSNTSNGLTNETDLSWFGLATTAIDSIVQPTVGVNEVLKLWYRVTVPEFFGEGNFGDSDIAAPPAFFDPSVAFSPESLQFATGSAQADGTPNFDGDHPMHIFSAIPEPSTLLLAVFAGLAMTGRKRR